MRVCSRARLPAPYPAPLRPARGAGSASSADSADSADSQRAGAQVLRGAEDGCFLLLALQSGHVEFTVRAHAGAVLAAAVCDEGARYVTAAVDGCVPPPPRPPSCTDWTRLVPPPVLTGHVSSRCVKCWDPERLILERTFQAPYQPTPQTLILKPHPES